MFHVELLALPGTSAEPKSRGHDHDRPRAKITKLVSAFLPIIARMLQEVRTNEGKKIILNDNFLMGDHSPWQSKHIFANEFGRAAGPRRSFDQVIIFNHKHACTNAFWYCSTGCLTRWTQGPRSQFLPFTEKRPRIALEKLFMRSNVLPFTNRCPSCTFSYLSLVCK